jgi:LCP family protein required for cell wall assembly
MDPHKYPQQNPLYPAPHTNGGHDVLPPPQQAVWQQQGRAAPGSAAVGATHQTAASAADPDFPPLGSTLSTYSPGQPGGYATARPASPGSPAPRKHRSWKRILKRTLITLLVIGLLWGGYVGVKVAINAAKAFDGNLFGLLQQTKLQGEDTGRVNILLAGNSADDAGHNGGELTDSIMIVSLDVRNNTAFMLSIPRDLWVNIPGEGYSKINAAYPDGKADKFSDTGYPAGGMGLLEKTIENNFNIDLNYYALVNYTAMRDGVNAVGGIDVNIQSTDPRGLYDPSRDWTGPYGTPLVKLTNGVHHLSGQQALNLARARGDTYGSYGYGTADFTRTQNQRLMLVALKEKATSAGVLANPIKVGQLLDSVGNNVQTDFQTKEVRRLSQIGQKIPSSSIKSVGLSDVNGKNLLTSYRSYNGQSALIPKAGVDDYSQINSYLEQLLAVPDNSSSSNQ